MAKLTLNNIYKVYEGGVRAVSDFNLEIADKEFVVFVGPSGCGKSTTLRMIAGLEEITAGDLYIDDVRVNDVEPKDRNIAMVFQNYALYPHMSVFQNMAFGLKLKKLPPAEIDKRVNNAAEILGIFDLLTRKPKALSGGQRQRVALGRAIVREPNVFLLDEPLSNLDAKLRVQMRTEITKLHTKLATTFIYVTHDQTEAMTMGDRIVVMKDGLIQQVDTPATLYEEPCNVFVATFLGSPQMNIFEAKLLGQEGALSIAFGDNHQVAYSINKSKQLADANQINQDVLFGIRPENVSIVSANDKHASKGIKAVIDVVEHLGSETIVYAKIDGIENNIIAKIPTDHSLEINKEIYLQFDMDKSHLFDLKTKQSVMGVPAVNIVSCAIENNELLKYGSVKENLPDYLKQRLFYFASNKCVAMLIKTDKVSLTDIPESLKIRCKVDFVVHGSDSDAIYSFIEGKDDYFVFRTKPNQVQEKQEIDVYVAYKSLSFIDEDGLRVNSREILSSNEARCQTKTVNGKTTIKLKGASLVFDDLKIADGEHIFKLIPDKVELLYNKKYAKKNAINQNVETKNILHASAYDEDKIGNKNTVFVKVKGFDDYVVALLDNDFSVYKMPTFGLIINQDSFEIM